MGSKGSKDWIKNPTVIAAIIGGVFIVIAALITRNGTESSGGDEPDPMIECTREFDELVKTIRAIDGGWGLVEEQERDALERTTRRALNCADGKTKGRIVESLYDLGAIRRDKMPMNLRDANLSNAVLIGVHLPWVSLVGANLEEAELFGRADVSGADLRDVHGNGIDLRCGVARGVMLFGARLVGADLRDADLSDASVDRFTTMGGAQTEGTILERVATELVLDFPGEKGTSNVDCR